MSPETIALLFNGAALVFFAGANWQLLRSHDKRIEKLEVVSEQLTKELATLQGEFK